MNAIVRSPISHPINVASSSLTGAGSLPAAYAGSDTNCLVLVADSNGGEILIRDTVTPANEGLFNVNVKLPHNGPQMFLDSDGMLKWNAGNQLHYSNDLTNWTSTGTTGATADTITDNDGAAHEYETSNTVTTVNGQKMLFTCEVTQDSTDKTTRWPMFVMNQSTDARIAIDTSDGEINDIDSAFDELTATLVNGKYRIRGVFTADSTSCAVNFYAAAGSNADLATQSTATTGSCTATNFSLRPYPCKEHHIVTTSAAIYYQPVEHDSNGDVRGFSWWGTRTNLCLYASDLTNAAWVKTNVTPTKDETGPDGVANSATKLSATAANGTVLQSIIQSSSERKQSAWVKRITGSGTINMTTDGGTTWGTISPTSVWTKLDIASQTLANPEAGFRIGTSGDEIAVAYVLNETGSVAGPAIPTYGSTVTQIAADNELLASGNFPIPSSYTLFAEIESMGGGQSWLVQVSDNTADNRLSIYIDGSDQARSFANDGAALQLNPAGVSIGTEFKIATRFKANDFGQSVDGGAVATDNSGTVSSATDRIHFAHYHTNSLYLNGYFKVGGLLEEKTDVQLQERSA